MGRPTATPSSTFASRYSRQYRRDMGGSYGWDCRDMRGSYGWVGLLRHPVQRLPPGLPFRWAYHQGRDEVLPFIWAFQVYLLYGHFLKAEMKKTGFHPTFLAFIT